MKTAIVQLEKHDNVASTRDKLSWCKSPQILIVWPKKDRVFHQFLDIELIKRSALAQGARLAFVSRDPVIKDYAESLHIPVFASIPQAEKARWVIDKRIEENPQIQKGFEVIYGMREALKPIENRKSLTFGIRFFLFLISLAALTALAIFILPSATVRLFPQTETQKINLTVLASNKMTEINLSGMIPATFQSVIVSGFKVGKSTGTIDLPQEKATGEVILSNLTLDAHTIPAGTIVSTGGDAPIRFALKNSVSVLPAPNDGVAVQVEALLPGEQGNVGPGSIILVESIYGSMIEASNSEPLVGGTSMKIPSPSEQDYERIQSILFAELQENAKLQLTIEEEANTEIVVPSLKLNQVISENRRNPVGMPSDEFTLELTVEYDVLAYKQSDILLLSAKVLDTSLPEGYRPLDSQISIQNRSEISLLSDNSASWQIEISRRITKIWDLSTLKSKLAGRKIAEAAGTIAESIDQIKPAEIFPFVRFWKIMPFLTEQIRFEEIY